MTIEIQDTTITLASTAVTTSTGPALASFDAGSTGELINDGAMSLTSSAVAVGVETASGSDPSALFDNVGSFVISGVVSSDGVDWASVLNSGSYTVTSSGSATGATGELVNSGVFSVSGGQAAGVNTLNVGSAGGLVQNLAGATFQITATGTALGVSLGEGGEFDNAGTMKVTGVTGAIGVSMSNDTTGYSTSYGLITNSGSIVVSGNNAIGVIVSGATASVPAGQYNLINSGVITASSAIVFVDGAGGQAGGPAASINNSGVINGTISLPNENESLLNTGTINGAITFGDGNDTINSSAGAINGMITVGAGNDTIALGAENDVVQAGAGADTIDGGGGFNTVIFGSMDQGSVILSYQGPGVWQMAAGGVVDVLKNVQLVEFADGQASLSATGSISIAATAASATVVVDGSGDLHIQSGAQTSVVANPQGLQFSDEFVSTAYASLIVDGYEGLFGRAPSGAELGVWSAALSSGTSATAFSEILADNTTSSQLSAEISFLYEGYFGRAPSAGEIGFWTSALESGATSLWGLNTILADNPAGAAFLPTTIDALYEAYLGRTASAAEIGVWTSALQSGGEDLRGMELVLAAQTGAAANETAFLTTDYQTWLGRAPTSSDLSFWLGLMDNGSILPSQIQTALVTAPAGEAYVSTQITSLYDTYFGRDPSSAEISVWQGLFAGGDTYGTLRSALVTSSYGQAHTATEVSALYETYFGRAPTTSEINVWNGLVIGGDSFQQVQDTLERASTSALVEHVVAVAGTTSYAFPTAPNYLTLDLFNPAADVISIASKYNDGQSFVGAAHAQQITALDGTTDVLITLDASHSILLEHMSLASLSASNFVFV